MSKNKTRTKDKYRVVYNDNQRIELENEFRLNEYIPIARKQEIAQKLQLSERQIKIWFQNRRAKKRKQQKRRQAQVAQSTVTIKQEQVSQSVSITCSTTNLGSSSTSTPTSGGRKSSPTIPAPAKASSGSPVTTLHHHHNHLHDTFQEPATLIGSGHEHRHHHHLTHQQHHQQQHQHHGRLAQSHNNNYYESNYQDPCHQDSYNIMHQNHRANIDPFQQPSPAALGATTGASSHQVAYSTGQCWPNLSQSTSPQITTSPAIIHQQFHSGTHQTPPTLPASVSPYHVANHANHATYTNGYQQQQHQHQQQHYIPYHHQPQHNSHHHAMVQSQMHSEDIYAA